MSVPLIHTLVHSLPFLSGTRRQKIPTDCRVKGRIRLFKVDVFGLSDLGGGTGRVDLTSGPGDRIGPTGEGVSKN